MAYSNGSESTDECSHELKLKIDTWLEWDRNATTRKEIEDLVAKEDWKKLDKLLMSRLAFGTAGLRGVMQAGFNAMNDLVVIQTAQGLLQYVLKCFPNEADRNRGIVLGYDGRHNSKRFDFDFSHFFILRLLIYLAFVTDSLSYRRPFSWMKAFRFISTAKWLRHHSFHLRFPRRNAWPVLWWPLHITPKKTTATRCTGAMELRSFRRMTRTFKNAFWIASRKVTRIGIVFQKH